MTGSPGPAVAIARLLFPDHSQSKYQGHQNVSVIYKALRAVEAADGVEEQAPGTGEQRAGGGRRRFWLLGIGVLAVVSALVVLNGPTRLASALVDMWHTYTGFGSTTVVIYPGDGERGAEQAGDAPGASSEPLYGEIQTIARAPDAATGGGASAAEQPPIHGGTASSVPAGQSAAASGAPAPQRPVGANAGAGSAAMPEDQPVSGPDAAAPVPLPGSGAVRGIAPGAPAAPASEVTAAPAPADARIAPGGGAIQESRSETGPEAARPVPLSDQDMLRDAPAGEVAAASGAPQAQRPADMSAGLGRASSPEDQPVAGPRAAAPVLDSDALSDIPAGELAAVSGAPQAQRPVDTSTGLGRAASPEDQPVAGPRSTAPVLDSDVFTDIPAGEPVTAPAPPEARRPAGTEVDPGSEPIPEGRAVSGPEIAAIAQRLDVAALREIPAEETAVASGAPPEQRPAATDIGSDSEPARGLPRDLQSAARADSAQTVALLNRNTLSGVAPGEPVSASGVADARGVDTTLEPEAGTIQAVQSAVPELEAVQVVQAVQLSDRDTITDIPAGGLVVASAAAPQAQRPADPEADPGAYYIPAGEARSGPETAEPVTVPDGGITSDVAAPERVALAGVLEAPQSEGGNWNVPRDAQAAPSGGTGDSPRAARDAQGDARRGTETRAFGMSESGAASRGPDPATSRTGPGAPASRAPPKHFVFNPSEPDDESATASSGFGLDTAAHRTAGAREEEGAADGAPGKGGAASGRLIAPLAGLPGMGGADGREQQPYAAAIRLVETQPQLVQVITSQAPSDTAQAQPSVAQVAEPAEVRSSAASSSDASGTEPDQVAGQAQGQDVAGVTPVEAAAASRSREVAGAAPASEPLAETPAARPSTGTGAPRQAQPVDRVTTAGAPSPGREVTDVAASGEPPPETLTARQSAAAAELGTPQQIRPVDGEAPLAAGQPSSSLEVAGVDVSGAPLPETLAARQSAAAAEPGTPQQARPVDGEAALAAGQPSSSQEMAGADMSGAPLPETLAARQNAVVAEPGEPRQVPSVAQGNPAALPGSQEVAGVEVTAAELSRVLAAAEAVEPQQAEPPAEEQTLAPPASGPVTSVAAPSGGSAGTLLVRRGEAPSDPGERRLSQSAPGVGSSGETGGGELDRASDSDLGAGLASREPAAAWGDQPADSSNPLARRVSASNNALATIFGRTQSIQRLKSKLDRAIRERDRHQAAAVLGSMRQMLGENSLYLLKAEAAAELALGGSSAYAKSLLSEVLTMDPGDKEARVNMVAADINLGNKDAAMRRLKTLVREYPEDTRINELLRTVQ